jgi:hypothetical protein
MKKFIFVILLLSLNFSIGWSQTKRGLSVYSSEFFLKKFPTQITVGSDALMMNGIEIDANSFKKFVFPSHELEGRNLKTEPFYFTEMIFNSPFSKVYSDPIDNILIYKPGEISPIPTYKPDSKTNFTIIIKDLK